ncbi:hypothetical protein BDR06DRAFT_636289 [Suillus hirtellus]|nr:hypothetical protein BDR06DRAFT_636289 [Suillus hirtellus]
MRLDASTCRKDGARSSRWEAERSPRSHQRGSHSSRHPGYLDWCSQQFSQCCHSSQCKHSLNNCITTQFSFRYPHRLCEIVQQANTILDTHSSMNPKKKYWWTGTLLILLHGSNLTWKILTLAQPLQIILDFRHYMIQNDALANLLPLPTQL